MNPLRILIEDFQAHRYTDIDCTQFRSTLIVARNRNNPRRSNGMGKTTIFKAIEYVLFGYAVINLDKIVRHGCDKAKVTFDFEIGSSIYRVVRSRNCKTEKSELRLFQKNNEDWLDITAKTSKETEVELAGIIRISHSAFKNSILFAQRDYQGLASASPKERKALLKEPLQISIYNKYEEIAKKKVVVVQKELDKINISIENLENPGKDIESYQNQLKLESEASDVALANKSMTKTQLESFQVQLAQLPNFSETVLAQLQKDHSGLLLKRAELQKKLNTKNTDLNNKENSLASVQTTLANVKKQLVTLDDIIQKLSSVDLGNKEEIQVNIVKLTQKEIDGQSYINSLIRDKAKLSKSIPDNDDCDVCRQPVTKTHRDNCEVKRIEELKELEANVEKYMRVLRNVKEKKTSLEKDLSSINARDTELSSVSNKITLKQNEISQLEKQIVQSIESIESLKLDLPSISKELEEIHPKIEDAVEKIAAAQNKEIQEKKIKLLAGIDKCQIEIANFDKQITQHNVNSGKLTASIETANDNLLKLKNFLEDQKKTEGTLRMSIRVRQAFASTGIPTMIINTILDDLQSLANEELQKIRPEMEICFSISKDKNGQPEDTLDINYRINGLDHEYEMLSGAQKVMVALCLKFAMSMVIQHRIGVDIKFLELDEVDSAFDDEGLEAYLNVVKSWQNRVKVFMVTHNKMLKDKFEHAILVDGDEINGSTGKLVTEW